MRALVLALVACTAADADPAPAVTITNLGPGRFVIDGKAKLRTAASIEGLRDGKWTPVSQYFDLGAGYRLVDTCSAKTSDCVELAGTLTPVPWSGMTCSSQCNMSCRANAPLPAGDYRLVVTTCDGASTIAGPSFHFDFDATPFERLGLTDDVTAATIARDGGHAKTLDDKARASLLALLRDRKGFATDIRKNCGRSAHPVAVVLSRAPGGHAEPVELSIDLACDHILAVFGAEHTTEAAFFDPSDAAWRAFVDQQKL